MNETQKIMAVLIVFFLGVTGGYILGKHNADDWYARHPKEYTYTITSRDLSGANGEPVYDIFQLRGKIATPSGVTYDGIYCSVYRDGH